MYSRIMVPVDLDHIEGLSKALSTAADLACEYSAEIVYVAVASNEPGHGAHSPEEFAARMDEFAEAQAGSRGIRARAHVEHSVDPAAELDAALLSAIETTDADLVVMASHIPGALEHLFASHGGYVASHAKVSVMLVR